MTIFKRLSINHFANKSPVEGINVLENINNTDVVIRHDVIAYPVSDAKSGYDFEGGLMDCKTIQLIEEAILIRHNKPSQEIPSWNYNAADTNKLPGNDSTFLYGGIIFNNFGHFLLESIGRLWAYNEYKKFDPYILFYAPWGIPDYTKKDNYMYQLFKGFSIPLNKLIFVKEIARFKTVIIPQQKYGFGKCKTPDTIFINFIQSFNIPQQYFKNLSAEKIYVSRSKLPFNTGRPFAEAEFEKYLQTDGYTVIYPEKISLYEQLAIYTKAKKIIFCDGGAMYATILLTNLKADIAIIARRRDYRWNYKELTEHFYGYKKEVLWIDEVVSQYQYGLETWDAAAEINWQKVSVILKNENFLEPALKEIDIVNYEELKRKELLLFIQSIQYNPLFLNYMQKLNEQHPILPMSF